MKTQPDIKLRECREAFEKEMSKRHYDIYRVKSDSIERLAGEYADDETRKHWVTWQAASRHTDKLLEMAVEGLNALVVNADAIDRVGLIEEYERAEQTSLTLQQHLGKE